MAIFNPSQEEEIRKIAKEQTAPLAKALEAQGKEYFALMSANARVAQEKALAGIDLNSIPITDDLNYFTAGEQFLAKPGVCPDRHPLCFCFRYPDGNGIPRFMHLRVISLRKDKRVDAPLDAAEQVEYKLLLLENGMPANGLVSYMEAQAGGQGGIIWQRVSNWILETQFARQTPDNTGPKVLQDGTPGMSGGSKFADQPGKTNASGLAGGPGATSTGDSEKVGSGMDDGSEVGGGKN